MVSSHGNRRTLVKLDANLGERSRIFWAIRAGRGNYREFLLLPVLMDPGHQFAVYFRLSPKTATFYIWDMVKMSTAFVGAVIDAKLADEELCLTSVAFHARGLC